MDDISRLGRYWQKNPPLGALLRAIAQALGVKFKDPAAAVAPMTYQEARRFSAMTGGTVTLDMIRNMMVTDE